MRYEEFVKEQLEKVSKAGVIDFGSMPELELYIDQLSAFFKNQMKTLDTEVVQRYTSKTSINTYTKNHLIPRPDGKHYSRSHMIMTAMVVYLRGIFKMEQIQQVMKPLVDNYNSTYEDKIDPAILYDSACKVNRKIQKVFAVEMDRSISDIKRYLEDTDLADDERMEIFILILSLAMKADMEKYMAERLLETYFAAPAKEKPEKFKMPKRPSDKKKEK